jgi:hypothetical protein
MHTWAPTRAIHLDGAYYSAVPCNWLRYSRSRTYDTELPSHQKNVSTALKVELSTRDTPVGETLLNWSSSLRLWVEMKDLNSVILNVNSTLIINQSLNHGAAHWGRNDEATAGQAAPATNNDFRPNKEGNLTFPLKPPPFCASFVLSCKEPHSPRRPPAESCFCLRDLQAKSLFALSSILHKWPKQRQVSSGEMLVWYTCAWHSSSCWSCRAHGV